ncbi:MAG TPA: FAD-binding oxidoreductase [Candidatus Limnocylindrales bacterium]|nr:FAD-binding oxidoreductase [Candidatus Limnocylindrales bacterium]
MIVGQSAIDELRRGFTGEVIEPGSAAYDDARRSFNAMIDRRPAVIAQPSDDTEVGRAVRFARDHDLPIGVRGGGHSVAGHGLVDDGVVIDLRRMRRVVVDPMRRRASAGGGANWEEFDGATQVHGLAVTGGTFVDTGIAGLTLGGGIGFLMGLCGLTCDNLIGAQVVDAEGRTLEVTAETDAELLWALRGGGGNFGICTRLDYRLHEVGRMFGGEVVVALGDGSVLRRYAEAQVWAPDGLVAMCYVANSPELGDAVSIQMAWLGTPATGTELANAILGDAPVLAGSFGPATYQEIQGIAGILPPTYRHYWKSSFVSDLSAPIVDEVVELIRQRPAGLSGILIEPIHGQARRYGFEHSCFPQRQAHFHVSGLGIWERPEDDDAEIHWVRWLAGRMKALGVGGTYVNYTAPDEPPDRARSAYPGPVFTRLRQIKRRVDPSNVFDSNVNIPPGA